MNYTKLSLSTGAVTSPKYSMRMFRKVQMDVKAYSGSTWVACAGCEFIV